MSVGYSLLLLFTLGYTHSLEPDCMKDITMQRGSQWFEVDFLQIIIATYFNVSENVVEYLVVRYTEGGVIIIRVGAGMDDTIHVKVEVIKLWNL